jgi:hypothetical protein
LITNHAEFSPVGLEETHPDRFWEIQDDTAIQSKAPVTIEKINNVKILAPGELTADPENGTNTRLNAILIASTQKIRTTIQLYTCMLESLELRSNAFEKRLQNEIKLVSILSNFSELI